MKLVQLVREFLAVASLASLPLAQRSVWVVDQKGGPGSDYTDLSDAFWSTGSGDVLLVRPGYYSLGGTADDRELTIVADGPGVNLTSAYLTVKNLAAGKRFVVRGIYFRGTVHLEHNEGIVWIEDCSIVSDHYFAGEIAALFAWDSNLVLSGAYLQGAMPYGFHGLPPTDGLSLSSATASITNAWIYGGSGQDSYFPDVPAANGVSAYNSTFALSNATVYGGSCETEPGGVGVSLASTSAWSRASSSSGGYGTPAGQALIADAASRWTTTAQPAPVLTTNSPVREGELVTVTVRSVPGDVVVLKAGLRPAFDPMGAGAFRLVDALPSLTVVLGVVPPDGTLTYSTPAPDLGAASAMELFLQTRHMAYVSERASAPHVPSQAAGPGSSVLLLGAGY